MSEEEVKINGKLLKELKVSELKYVCKERNLPSNGNKGSLVKRLKAAIELEKLQRAARNSPAVETLPNSDIAEDSGENDFIKQYMENQRKLLRSSRFSSTSEADSEDDTSSHKSGTVVSPLLGRRTRRSTKEDNDSSELETTNKTEDKTSGVQATVKSTQEEVQKKTRREVVKPTKKEKDEEVSHDEQPAPGEAAESLPVIQEEKQPEEQIQQEKVNGEEDAEKQGLQMEVKESEIAEPQHIQEEERSTKNVNIDDVTEKSKEAEIRESSNKQPEVHGFQPGDVPECERMDEDQGMQKSRREEEPSVTDSQEGETNLQGQESKVVQEEHHSDDKFEIRDQEQKSDKENGKQEEGSPSETFREPRQIVDVECQKEDRQQTEELQEASKEEIITEETVVDVDEIVNQEEELDYDENDAPSQNKGEAAAQKQENGDDRPVRGTRLRLKKDKKERKRSRTDLQKQEEKLEDEDEAEHMKEQSRKRGKSSASQIAKQKDEEKTPELFKRKTRKRIKRKSLEAKSEMIEPEQTEVQDDASDAMETAKDPDEKIDEPEEKSLEQEETVPEPEPRIPFRRIRLNKGGVSGDTKPLKRKWGGTSTDNVNISSDLIKNLIDVKSEDIRKAMDDREEPGELIEEEEEEEVDEIIDITMEGPDQDAENELGSTDRRNEKRTKRSKEEEEDGEIVEEEEVMVEELEEAESEGDEGSQRIAQHDNRKVVSSKSQRTVEEKAHKVVSRSDQKRSLKEGSYTASEKKKDSSRRKSSKTNVTVTNKSGPKEPTPPPQPREVSPSRYDPSKILHVRNLVRPFTVNQLQALFGKLGKVTEGSFWIDKIKSHCLISYETAEDAINARKCIHGINWPSSNPKQLSIDFCEQSRADVIKGIVLDKPIPPLMGDWNTDQKSKSEAEEKTKKDETRSRRSAPDDGKKSEEKNRMEKKRDRERHEKDDLPRRRSSPKGADPRKDSSRDKDRRRSPERRRREDKKRGTRKEEITKPLREWDRDKLDQEVEHRKQLKECERRSPQRNERREARDRKQKEEPKPDEQPAKLLDDLFRKTKATPCIYWLPLTDKQLAQRIKEREERREARNKIRREMEEEESRNRAKMAAERKERGASSPDRRRPSDRLRRDSTSDRRPEHKPAERTGSRGSGERASLTRKRSPKAGGGEKPPAKSSSDSSSSNSSSGSESGSDSDSSSDSSPKKK